MFIVVLRAVLIIALLLVIQFGLDTYMRWDRRKTLEERHAEGEAPGLSREDFVAKGLAEYERSWERKLLNGVFLVPPALAIVLWWIAK